MTTYRRALACSTLVLGLSVPGLASCGGNATPATTTIAPTLGGQLASNPSLTVIAELLRLTGIENQVTSGKSYTLFLATNDAIDVWAKARGFESADAFLAAARQKPGTAQDLVLNSVVEDTVRAQDFVPNAGETFQTLTGLQATIQVVNGIVSLKMPTGTATITSVELLKGTVTVHVIDAVLS